MYLLDKIINNSMIDNNLKIKLNDLSYRATNGVRQPLSRTGIVNPGSVHFNQPKDQITKEMILEYQKEQQNIPAYTDSAGNLLKYFPARHHFDVGNYQYYVPINETTLGDSCD